MTIGSSSLVRPEADTKFSFISSLKDIKCSEWNALLNDDNPFLRYEFLRALERNGCLGEKFGWFPHHLIVLDEKNTLIAATPLYIKTNSYGEFVFDWSWASAYEQAGLSYYPKMVSSIPYTPVTCKRLLISSHLDSKLRKNLTEEMVNTTIQEAQEVEFLRILSLILP